MDREGADAACQIIDGAERGDFVLHLCSLSVTNIYYSLRKMLTHEERINALTDLCDTIEVLNVDANIISKALRSGWKDFEDSVQYFAAIADSRIEGIITRNTKDFKYSELEVIHSLDFINH